jgi:hypothetical protein
LKAYTVNLKKEKKMQFKKIKITSQGFEAAWKEVSTKEDETTAIAEHSVKSKDQAHPDLSDSLQALRAWVEHDEGLTKKAEINITGISLFNDGDTVIVSHTKKLKSGTTGRSSGRVAYDEEDQQTVTLFNLIETVKKEAVAYIKEGKRAQLEMAFE